MAYKTKRKTKKQKKKPFDVTDSRVLSNYDRAASDPKRSAKTIVALLRDIARDGYPPGDVFVDFLRLAEVMIDRLPHHVRHINKTGQVDPTDPPEIAAFYAGLRERYPPKTKRRIWEDLVAAVAILVFISTGAGEEIYYQDTIGQVYLDFVRPDDPQAIIPFPQALKRIKKESLKNKKEAWRVLSAHLAAAGLKAGQSNPLALSVLNTGLIGADAAKTRSDHLWVSRFAQDNILPAILPYYEPVRIFTPLLGSGAPLLAAASLFPDWVVQTGLVQFEGADPDPLCIQMTTVNAKVYGLNGAWLEANRAIFQTEDEEDASGDALELFRSELPPEVLERLPEALRALYAAGDPPDQKEINKARRATHVTLLNEKGDLPSDDFAH